MTVNGTSYRIFYELGGGDGTGYPSGYGSLNTSGVPIPKGVSSMTFNMYDDGSIGRPGDVRGGSGYYWGDLGIKTYSFTYYN